MRTFPKILILVLIIGVMFGAGLVWKESQKPGGISGAEKQKIETWIEENNLNKYGDPKNIMYIGGTPLFDEKTGRSIDRYEYIFKMHPSRPWLK